MAIIAVQEVTIKIDGNFKKRACAKNDFAPI
jgi:hypothetical protein